MEYDELPTTTSDGIYDNFDPAWPLERGTNHQFVHKMWPRWGATDYSPQRKEILHLELGVWFGNSFLLLLMLAPSCGCFAHASNNHDFASI
jgi:hypothetical protein